jgi:hypothetical protein
MLVHARLARFVAFVTVGAFAFAGAAQGATTQVKYPFSGNFINTCTGESIQFDGFLHDLIRVEQDAIGNYHIHAQTNGQGLEGVGVTSGVRYSIPAASHNDANFDPTNVPFAATTTQTFDLISAGSGDNATLTVIQHLTMSATGEVAVYFSDVTLACRG